MVRQWWPRLGLQTEVGRSQHEVPTESWTWTISPRQGVKEGRVERVPAHVKAEAELPVGNQGRDGQRGGKKIRRKRSHICLPASIPENGFQEWWAKPACSGWMECEGVLGFPTHEGQEELGYMSILLASEKELEVGGGNHHRTRCSCMPGSLTSMSTLLFLSSL